MRAIDELTDLLAELPGIGPRQGRRIVQFLLGRDAAFREKVSELVKTIGKNVSQCRECFRFADGMTGGLCALCADGTRDRETLMVVEKDVDIEGVEAAHAYHGLYFVFGGLIPMARQRKNGNGVHMKELLLKVQKDRSKEVILALSATPEGDYTAREIIKELKTVQSGVKATLLGRGLSLGAEIEYADQETLRSALQGRSERF